MGLLFNLQKSHLEPTMSLQWLGLQWDTRQGTVALSSINRKKCWRKLLRNLCSVNISRREWESLLGSLNHAAEIIPFGRIHLRHLQLEGRAAFTSNNRDKMVFFPRHIRSHLRWWLRRKRLMSVSPWVPKTPSLILTTDASDWGWGYQSSKGHQGSGLWKKSMRRRHINVRELQVVIKALHLEKYFLDMSIQVLSDNIATVYCINKQGSSRSKTLLKSLEILFRVVKQRRLHLTASHLEGRKNQWADTLSRQTTSSVEWALDQEVFQKIAQKYGHPQIDLFASHSNPRIERYLTRAEVTVEGGPDAFLEDWNKWKSIYLFPPPLTSIMLRVINHLRSYKGKVLLIAPLWEAQPWIQYLLHWCPQPLPRTGKLLQETRMDHVTEYLRLHV
ncbi:uncharacterized protein LOC134778940 [Penaeus indicus]|uniref:uncharacterized protein LOC134778940 n=1 Tax=Penaeus indicus TaxID=29960 RepID=UPI00300CAF92